MNARPFDGSVNRAVSPLFRLFGGYDGPFPVGRFRRSDYPGSHPVECLVLGLIIPFVVGSAILDALWRIGGVFTALIGVIPVTFIALHVLAFGLRLKRPAIAFWVWSALLTVWSLWIIFRAGPTPVSLVGWAWLSFMALQALALLGMGWKKLMLIQSTPGQCLRMLIIVVPHLFIVSVFFWGSLVTILVSNALVFLGWVTWMLGTFRTSSSIFGPMVTRVIENRVLVTIDDGPDPESTPGILDALDRYDVKAVFFVIGERVAKYPELAREIVQRGHEIANHTMTHPQAMMWGLGPWRTRREIVEGQQIIKKVTGESPRWFRAPVGHRNVFTHPVTRQLGLDVVAWTHRAFDTIEHDVPKLVERLTDGLRPGDVILIHENTPVTVELTEALLLELSRLKLLTSRSDDY